MESVTLMEEWLDFVYELALETPTIVAGSQAIYWNKQWKFPAHFLLADTSMQVGTIGFTQTKISHLTRHYENKPTIEKAKSDLHDRIKARKYGSGRWDFRGEIKKTTKQDYCLMDGVVSYFPQLKQTRIFIAYRTVELIFRFRADLIFLRDIILPQLEIPEEVYPTEIVLQFANCTIHPMFGAMFLLELDDPYEFLNTMRDHNPWAFKQWVRWTKIHLEGDYKSYLTAARVQKFLENYFNDTKRANLHLIVEGFST